MRYLIILFFTLWSALTLGAQTKDATPIDRVVAVVNDDIIAQSELDSAITMTKMQLQQKKQIVPPDDILASQLLDRLINDKLQIQVAKRNNLEIDSDTLNNAINGIAKKNHVSLKDLKTAIEAQGMDYAEYRKQIRHQMLLSKVQQFAVSARVTINEDEVKTTVKKANQQVTANRTYHLRDILIPLPQSPSTQDIQHAKSEAKEILQKLNKGENFEKLAAEYSHGKQALEGGDLGWRKKVELPDLFVKTVVSMKDNTVAGPLRAANGFHVLKLLGTKSDSKAITTAEAKQIIFRRKFEEEMQSWIQQIRDGAYIKTMLS